MSSAGIIKPKNTHVLDNIGNRLTSTNNGSSTSYTANNLNQYSDIDGTNLTYDADGNMLSNNGWTYQYNGENRLVGASNGTTVVSFGYDYAGRRFSKTVDGEETTFVYDRWNMVRESSSAETNYYVWRINTSGGVGALLSVIEADGEVYFPVADANGNVTGYIDDAGNVEAVYTFDAFGEIISSSGVKCDDFKFRFSTKYQDETGLNYYGYRYYDAEMGRWLSRDPVNEYMTSYRDSHTLRNMQNEYFFVFNNPYFWIDYMGLEPEHTDVNHNKVNCVGHAAGVGVHVQPKPDSTPKQMVDELGFDCKKINKGDKCDCPCEEKAFILYFRKRGGNFVEQRKDPFETPFKSSKYHFKAHAVRRAMCAHKSEDGKDKWDEIKFSTSKDYAYDPEVSYREGIDSGDIYTGRVDKRWIYCCCEKDKSESK